MKNLIKCDKCGKIEEMNYYFYCGYVKPLSWKETDIGDLCPDCYKEYKKFLEEFKNK